MGTALTILIVLLIAGLFVWLNRDEWFEQKKTTINASPTAPRRSRIKEAFEKIKPKFEKGVKYLKIVLGLFVVHGLLAYFFTDLWLFLAKKPLFWVDHIVIFLTVVFLTEEVEKTTGKEKTKTKSLTALGVIVLFILLCGNIFSGAKLAYEKITENSKQAQTTTSSSSLSNLPAAFWKPVRLRPNDPEGKDTAFARKFWDAHPSSNGITTEDMMTICQNESNCTHRNSDGTVKRNKNNNGAADDIGLLQINEGYWEKEVKQEVAKGNTEIASYDITTIEGNLKAARHIRDKYGLKPWNPGSKTLFKMRILEIKTNEWSEQFDFTRINVDLYYGGNVYAMDENGILYEDGPGKNIAYGPKKLRFKSREEKSVNLYISVK